MMTPVPVQDTSCVISCWGLHCILHACFPHTFDPASMLRSASTPLLCLSQHLLHCNCCVALCPFILQALSEAKPVGEQSRDKLKHGMYDVVRSLLR